MLRGFVSAALLIWILTRPDLRHLGNDFWHLKPRWLMGGFLCAGLAFALSAWRWQACLRALGIEIGLMRLFKISLVAAAIGCVSFGALGVDLAKVMLVGRQLPSKRMRVLSSIALDHVSALPFLLGMVLVALIAHGIIPEIDSTGVWIFAGVLVLTVLAILVLAWKFEKLHIEGLLILKSPATWIGLLTAASRSIPMWLSYCGVFYCAARAFGVVVPIEGFAGMIAIADGLASLPLTIAGLGVREEAFQLLFVNWYGVPASSAVGISLTGFLLSLVWSAVGVLGINHEIGEVK